MVRFWARHAILLVSFLIVTVSCRQGEPPAVDAWGYVDKNGRTVIPPKYVSGKPFSQHRALIHDGTQYSFIDTNGNPVVRLDCLNAESFAEGAAYVNKADEGGFRVQYIDTQGHALFSIRHAGIGALGRFSEGITWIKDVGGLKFIDKNGSVLSTNEFDSASVVSEGLVRVVRASINVSAFVRPNGQLVIPPSSQIRYQGDFREGLARAARERKQGFVDKNGYFHIKPQFEDAKDFSEGLAPVRLNERWGYISQAGDLAIEPRFESACEFVQGVAAVKVSGRFGFIDKRGSFVAEPKFDQAFSFSEGLARVVQQGKYGYIDMKGRIVIKPRFAFAMDFSEGLACVYFGDRDPHDFRREQATSGTSESDNARGKQDIVLPTDIFDSKYSDAQRGILLIGYWSMARGGTAIQALEDGYRYEIKYRKHHNQCVPEPPAQPVNIAFPESYYDSAGLTVWKRIEVRRGIQCGE